MTASTLASSARAVLEHGPSGGPRGLARPGRTRDIRVLIVDDNEGIHDDFRRILANTARQTPALGELSQELFGGDGGARPRSPAFIYDVASAAQGAAGVALARSAVDEGRPFSVAFVDMRMPPGWNGVETTSHLWKVDPHLQVVLCTAYSDFRWDEVMEFLGTTANLHLLRKPFAPGEVRRMSEVLGTKALRLRARG